MPLRTIILSTPETLSDMLLAADDRYRDAEDLLVHQRFDGSVYMLGYAVEMWLKAVCLRLRGHSANGQVKAALPPLRKWMASVAPQITFTDYHDPSYFAASVLELRTAQGRPLDIHIQAELQSRIINGIHREWIVDMRYRRSGLTAQDAWAALTNAWWMKTNWPKMT